MAKYGWLKHDGRAFGSQEIVDDDFILTTDFVKQDSGFHGGEWTARIKGRPRFGKVRVNFPVFSMEISFEISV